MKLRTSLCLLVGTMSLFFLASVGYADDLSFSVTVSPQTVKIGDTITYHCVATNVGTTTVSTFYLYSGPDNENSNDDIYTSYASSNPQPFYVDNTGFKYINFPASSLNPGDSTSLDILYKATANGHPVRLMGVSSSNDTNPSNDSSDAACTISNASGGASFDAVQEFNGSSNSSLQVWQYGYSETDGTGFTNYTTVTDYVSGNLRAWRKDDSDMGVAYNKTNQNLSYNSCTTQQPNVLGLFPGNDGRKTVVRWKAPAAGTYTVQGHFQDIDTTTSDYAIVKNSDITHPLFSGFINDSTCNSTSTIKTFSLTVTVASGDTIDFRVGWGSNSQYSYDGTGLAATITTAGGVSPTPTPRPTASPTPPAHGGLSSTDFTVNESHNPTANVTDTVLRFAAVQTGQPANLKVRVQASTTPNVESSWTDLTNGFGGVMTYDTAVKKFVLGSVNYPLANGVYFRAIASASGYPDSISNKVGPFSLASNRPRVVPPAVSFTVNGPFADLYVRAQVSTANSAINMRVQTSTNPTNESSWTDMPNGAMQISNDPKRYYLLSNKVPAGRGIYFRVYETRLGYVNGATAASGPFAIVADTPPVVTMIAPKGSSGMGTYLNPIVITGSNFHFGANASSTHAIKELKLMVDGSTIYSFASQHAETDFNTTVYGQHILEAAATDELGATSRGSANAIYIRVEPAASAEHTETVTSAGHTTEAATTSGKVFLLVKDNGLWSDPSSWQDERGKSGVPGANDLAIIESHIVKVSAPVTVKGIVLDDGIFNTKDIPAPEVDLTVTGLLTIGSGGAVISNMHLILPAGATCQLLNTAGPCLITGSVDNYGKFNVHGGEGVTGLLHFNNYGTSDFQVPAAVPANAGKDPTLDNRTLKAANVLQSGVVLGSLTSLTNNNAATFINLTDGSSLVAAGGGNVISNDGAGLIGQDGGGVISNDGAGLIGQDGGGLIGNDGGGMQAPANEHAASAPAGIVQEGGNIDLSTVHLEGPVTLNGGVLSGSGIIYGNLTNNGGYIAPGHSAGAIGVTGNFTQGPNGTLILEDGGALPNQFDQLQVGGSAKLGGTLDLKLIDSYKPSTADTFNPLGYASHTGNFAHVSSNGHVTVNATGILTTVNKAVAQPVSGHPLNISTRLEVQNGSNVLIAGFIVTGPAGSSKNVLIRGLGPSLPVAGALADPILELHRSNGSVITNDNWKMTQEAAIKATGIPPKNDLESAIVAKLPAGSYTAILKGVNGGTGIGLVEVYNLDDDATATAILGNISTRGFVDTGDNVMIGGFIIGGTEPARILVRALGPSLTAQKVKGALADTVLELHDANGSSIVNDDWRETQESDIIASTVAPTNNKESAIIATLTPGNYTAVVRGKNNTTGVALVEAYTLQ